jgi:hypothetical protein
MTKPIDRDAIYRKRARRRPRPPNSGQGVHDGVDNGRIPAMPCSDLQPARNVGVAGFVTGGAGV